MSSTALNYQLSAYTGVLNHGHRAAGFVRDMATEPHKIVNRNLEARVRSGDYFIALATQLDALSQNVEDYPTRAAIEDAVSDLIYLYDHYTINKA